MKYSVVIPVYNLEKYISECIESVLYIRPEDCQIVIVDDGSTDDSYRIARDFQEDFRNVKVVHQDNMGPMKARLSGIRAAEGDWIVFLDGDDRLDKRFFEIIGPIVDGMKEEDILVTNMARFDDSKIYGREFNWDELGVRKDKWKIPPYFGGRIFSRKLLTKKFVVPKRKYFYEDPGFMGQLLPYINKVYFTEEPLYLYRQRYGSTSLLTESDVLYDMLISLECAYRFIARNDLWHSCRDEFERYVIVNLMLNNMARMAVNDPHDRRLFQMHSFMNKRFKNYKQNRYLKDMGYRNRLYFMLLSNRCFMSVCAIGRIKKLIRQLLTELEMDEIIKIYQKEAVK